MQNKILPPQYNLPIANETGGLSRTLYLWAQSITDRALIVGSGSPEGVIAAGKGAMYMDEDAATGDILYLKRLTDIGGDSSQGWRVV